MLRSYSQPRKEWKMETCTYCHIKTPDLGVHFDIAHREQEAAKLDALEAQKASLATNNVMLFFEELPDSAKVYFFKVTDGELVMLENIHDNLFDDKDDSQYQWLQDFLVDHAPLYTVGDSAPKVSVDGKVTLICTGLTVEAEHKSEDELDLLEEDEEEPSELSTDPKAYYFHAFKGDDAIEVVIALKEHFDLHDGVFESGFVSDFLDLDDKFEEIEPGLFLFDGPIEEATAKLVSMGMIPNSNIIVEV